MSNEGRFITILSTASPATQQFLRADGTWVPLVSLEELANAKAPEVVVKDHDPPGPAATLALGAAALAAKNPVVSRRFWGRRR